MSKKEELVDEYLALCDEYNERPELDKDGDPDPYCRHARDLRKSQRGEVAVVEQGGNPLAALGDKGEIAGAVMKLVGAEIGKAIGEAITPIREELNGLRGAMNTSNQIRRNSRAQGHMLDEEDWNSHEEAYQASKGKQNGGFTLMELMISIAIIAVLAALMIGGVSASNVERSEEKNSRYHVVMMNIHHRDFSTDEVVFSDKGITCEKDGGEVFIPYTSLGYLKINKPSEEE